MTLTELKELRDRVRGLKAEEMARARLNDAAPKLLMALQIVANSGKFECMDDSAWDVVNDAIAQATGEDK